MTVRERVLDLLFPPKCPFCQKILAEPRAPVCPECRPGLPWLEGAAGERQVDFADGCFSPLAYRGTVPQAVHRYKFSRVRALGRPFAALMARCLSDRLPEGADLLCWAPLSKKRLRERGFDQAELLAREVGKALALPVVRTLDKEERPAQSTIEGEAARRANLLGAYTAHEPEVLRGKSVLLVDDVLTTGATLSECARTLLLAGAERVACATLARAEKGGNRKEK